MTYILTTRSIEHAPSASGQWGATQRLVRTDRQALATLADAQRAAYAIVRDAWHPSHDDAQAARRVIANLPEAGGTVGPLPGGSFITIALTS